jgi:hypothetical protein
MDSQPTTVSASISPNVPPTPSGFTTVSNGASSRPGRNA